MASMAITNLVGNASIKNFCGVDNCTCFSNMNEEDTCPFCIYKKYSNPNPFLNANYISQETQSKNSMIIDNLITGNEVNRFVQYPVNIQDDIVKNLYFEHFGCKLPEKFTSEYYVILYSTLYQFNKTDYSIDIMMHHEILFIICLKNVFKGSVSPLIEKCHDVKYIDGKNIFHSVKALTVCTFDVLYDTIDWKDYYTKWQIHYDEVLIRMGYKNRKKLYKHMQERAENYVYEGKFVFATILFFETALLREYQGIKYGRRDQGHDDAIRYCHHMAVCLVWYLDMSMDMLFHNSYEGTDLLYLKQFLFYGYNGNTY